MANRTNRGFHIHPVSWAKRQVSRKVQSENAEGLGAKTEAMGQSVVADVCLFQQRPGRACDRECSQPGAALRRCEGKNAAQLRSVSRKHPRLNPHEVCG